MKKPLFRFLSSMVCLILLSATAFAAIAPIGSIPSPTSSAVSSDIPPASYLNAIKALQQNTFSQNDIKSIAFQIFSTLDRHGDVGQLLLLFADEDLDMLVPEGAIRSHKDFQKWYAAIGSMYQSNLYTVEKIEVSIPGKGDYRVDLTVNWQAVKSDGHFTSARFHHVWKLVDGGGYFPRVVSFVVEPVH